MFFRKFPAAGCALALVLAFASGARAAGGELAGTVTDPQGAVVVGAQVSATESATGKTSTAVTDAQGNFKLPGLPAGSYAVVVVAPGFVEARREGLRIEDGRATRADFQLQIALDAGSVTVTAGKAGRGDEVYRQLRNQAATPEDFSTYASVNNLVLRRDAGVFTLRAGELYFVTPVEGRTVGAVFLGEGEFTLTPPVEHEKNSLKLFTGEPSVTEQFTRLILRFTDKTFEEVKAAPGVQFRTGGAQAARARDLYRENQSLLRKDLRTNYELRSLVDLYAPQRPGFFTAFIVGKRFEKLVYQLDPLGIPEVSPEEIMLASYGQSDGGFWTAFHLGEEYGAGKASSNEDHRLYDITRHELDVRIDGTKIAATDRLTLRPIATALRVLPFRLFRTLRVARVEDEQGRELQFVQEGRDSDADFGVILAEPLPAGKDLKLTVEYAGGDAIADLGGGNYYLGPRSTWYPNNYGTQFGDRAAFDITFRYAKAKTLIGTGALAEPVARDGDLSVAKWTSGGIELAVSGFNIGQFKTKTVKDADTGYDIEFYANNDLPNFMRGAEQTGSMSTTGMADSAIADAQNSTRIFNVYFGKLPYTRVAMTQQPAGNFGQAWPTLVYMPFTAFMDSTQRYMATGSAEFAGDDFFRYVGPHEVAHQWWGHTVGWTSYRDQWMSEGFAQFSTSLYVQQVHGFDKFVDFWKDERELIITARPQTLGRKPYTVGPVTQGYRLNSGKTGNIARFMIYPKGGYILHMLRMIMFDPKQGGDKRFMAMMQDFTKTHFNKDVSTEDFKRAVERHMIDEMNLDGNGRMDWFFNQWVYGTELPSYRLEYRMDGDVFNGSITQSGVSDGFKMRVPLYLDFGKGWVRLGAANISGNKTIEIKNVKLPAAPKRVAVGALQDVLALDIDTVKSK